MSEKLRAPCHLWAAQCLDSADYMLSTRKVLSTPERQQEADDKVFPRRKEGVIWRNGIGMPESFLRGIPEHLLPADVRAILRKRSS